ncbi:ADP-ribose diphosphatase [Candidatus Tenderia electrophaga]|jgi:ADP-ribose diphosphatase|uniref:ADP-ribose diphosphatase n=1 Tax=Candidatus Tenderia electrophaga TaxID=1748243 RepID=A0A0S2TAS4_9GAMM|nr:ADP-ribose diphosphatase [Candidatus Tenderia electrophaga]
MRRKPEILAAETIIQTRLFHLERVDLRFANGMEVQYERLKTGSGGAVLVVPMLDDDTVMLIREYAAGVHRYELALPKGRIEAGEDPLAAADRELMEEIGYGAKHLEHLTTFSVAPGYLGHQTQVILAQGLYPQRLAGDEPEEIEVVPWSLTNLSELVGREDVTEARSIAALYWVRDLLADRRGA